MIRDQDVPLTENRPDRWMIAAAVLIAIAYGWFGAFALEPRLELPRNVISSLAWSENGEAKSWLQIRRHRSRALAQIAGTIRAMEREIELLGGFREPPSILIFAGKTTEAVDRYAVSDSSLELSEAIATSKGQLRKALLKAWILQNSGSDGKASAVSLLLLEVLSDALAAMLTSENQFSLPEGEAYTLPNPDTWLRYAGSINSLCLSSWASLDLQGRCGRSKKIHSLAFRPLLGGMIWRVFNDVPTLHRLEFIRAWSMHLKELKATVRLEPRNLVEWKDWVRTEWREILPVKELVARTRVGEKSGDRIERSSAEMERAIGLGDEDRPHVDLVFRTDVELSRAANLKAVSDRVYAVVLQNKRVRLFPGDAELSTEDLQGLTSPVVVWESCSQGRLGDLLSFPVTTDRYLYVSSCDAKAKPASWAGFARSGLGGFASQRDETTEFVQLNRENIGLAFRHGVLSASTPLASLMKKSESAVAVGLDQPRWQKDVGAYRVLGAIEVVEWYRSTKPSAVRKRQAPREI